MSVTNESEAKIAKAVEDIISVLKRAEKEFTEEEGILFAYRLDKAMKKEGYV